MQPPEFEASLTRPWSASARASALQRTPVARTRTDQEKSGATAVAAPRGAVVGQRWEESNLRTDGRTHRIAYVTAR